MEMLRHIAARLHAFYVEGWADVLHSLGLACLVVVAVLVLELAFVPWQQSSVRRLLRMSATVRTDLLAFVLVETNLSLFIGMAMFFGVTYVVQHQATALGPSLGRMSFDSPTLAFIVFFLVNDFANYWTHRLCHQMPVLWETHRYHHSAPEMTVLTAARDHPMERAFSAMVAAIPAAVLAIPTEQFALLHLLAKAVGLLKHSNLTGNWGWVGRYVIQAPAAHRVHHSMEVAHHNRNFASLFQFWDVLFGTAMHPNKSDVVALRLGVDRDDGQSPAWRYVGRVCISCWRRLLGLAHG
jgi:sterol desaturase/sphingolipid hydroxylase (fatty acid hydroxylase superfamily)